MKKVMDFGTFKRLKNMSFNDFNRWLESFYKAAFDDGRAFGNQEMDEYYHEEAEVYTHEELFNLLVSVKGISPRLAKEAIDVIMPGVVDAEERGLDDAVV